MVDVAKRVDLKDGESRPPEPLPIEFMTRHLDAADWLTRDGFELRDLGLSEASHGLLDASHYRCLRDGVVLDSDRISHDLDVFYVLAGSLSISRDNQTSELLQEGDCIHHRRECACRYAAASSDCELLHIRSRGTLTSDAPEGIHHDQDATAPAGPSNCYILKNTPESYVIGAGPRSFFGYRDLGANEVTDGRIHLHMVRATSQEAPSNGTGWHIHSMSQWYIVTGGVGNIDVAAHGRHRLVRGDFMTISAQMPHNEFEFSPDYEVIQLCTPARYETVAVEAL